ncbi:LCP family protein [Nocardia nova]|uniref:LytR family transcriptional regulator n=1 Tax=Nocardia nova TaxID=37330 RepID=A0A2S6AE04_9NOCA|nr:LCP family protein [Nocardia nova]PPJ32323.1 LytR family transcriptional regulator [Nocardia nova]
MAAPADQRDSERTRRAAPPPHRPGRREQPDAAAEPSPRRRPAPAQALAPERGDTEPRRRATRAAPTAAGAATETVAAAEGTAPPPNRRARRARTAPPPRPNRGGKAVRVGGRVLAAVTAVVVVSGTGLAYYTERSVDQGFTRSNAISEADAAALDGDLNILLIGLDTRKDQNGNDLPKNILDQLHAGDGSEGGYNANSLILVHIPKDLKKVTAFSIPRDDYVAVSGIPGYDHAKIKEAYGLKKASVEQKLENQGVKDKVELERQGREAGRESIVQTVKQLTGVPINRFAEISLVGFYDLANILGGVDVCLNHAVDDEYYSGAVFPAGRQHLDAANALSFVRQRHGLDNGDLDRTHRQQAFLTSVAKQLKDSGTLTNIGKLQDLISAAQNDIVLSQGWNLLDFAQTLGRAGSIPIEFQTLPVKAYDTVDGQDVNIVDPAAIKKTVRTAFGVAETQSSAPTTTPTSTIDVVNAGGASGMAAKVSTALVDKGFRKGNVGNATYSDGSSSVVYFGSGADTDATQAADMLGGLPTAASKSLDPGTVKIVIGSDFSMPDSLTSSSASSVTTTDPTTGLTTTTSGGSSASTTATTDDRPDSGKPVTTSIGSDIPCVN